MNIRFLTGLCLAIATLAHSAQAEERWPRWYLGLSGSGQFNSDGDISGPGISTNAEYDTGYGFTAALGYQPSFGNQFFDNTRYELEFGYRSSDIDTVGGATANGDVTSLSYMVNAYYDFRNSSRFTPYLGLGLGMANVDFDPGIGANDENVFAYQFMLGLTYAPETLPMTEWGVGYRYFATDDVEVAPSTELEYSTHSVEANVKLRF
ncbi:MAG: porin family protein [Alphaproteobacteria bacterium]|nr:porin family protein [Alphaproteobacteria bacterium]